MSTKLPVIQVRVPKLEQQFFISSSSDAEKIVRMFWDKNELTLRESAKAMYLNGEHNIIGVCDVGTGSLTKGLISYDLIFAVALKLRASFIILFHNHVDNASSFSGKDILLAQQFGETSKLFQDLEILDFMIICPDSYMSMNDKGKVVRRLLSLADYSGN